MAKRFGARVLIDGAQSVAHLPVNAQQLGCDFYVFSGHKIFGPTAYATDDLTKIPGLSFRSTTLATKSTASSPR